LKPIGRNPGGLSGQLFSLFSNLIAKRGEIRGAGCGTENPYQEETLAGSNLEPLIAIMLAVPPGVEGTGRLMMAPLKPGARLR
jgi:hypothetical protein